MAKRARSTETDHVQTSGAAPPAPVREPAVDTASILERFKDYPTINIISRRFTHPGDPGTVPILLHDESPDACTNTDHQWRLKPGAASCHIRNPNGSVCGKPVRRWYVRFANTAEQGRWSELRALGYLGVPISELLDQQDVADMIKGPTDDFVRRGDRGQDVLVKIPLEIYTAIDRIARQQRAVRMVSPKRLREDLANIAGEELGDEAGQTVHDEIQVESLKRQRTTLGAEISGLANTLAKPWSENVE